MKRVLLTLALVAPMLLWAQNPKLDDPAPYRPFSHIDLGFTVGSTGFGFDLATPMGRHLDLRLGFTFVPPIGYVKGYDMARMGNGEPTEADIRRIDKMCQYLSDFTQTKVDRMVDFDHKLFSYSGKIMLDWYPFRQRNVHFTIGAFIGSSYVGYARSTASEGATMVGINMYNALYDQVQNLEEWEYPSITIGDHSIELDPVAGQEIKDRLNAYGPMRIHLGDFPDGTPHYLVPDEHAEIRMELKTAVFKPYIGMGYNAYLGRDQRWNVGFDAGILVLGRSPHIYGNDGVCLTHDVKNVGGQIGKYVRLIASAPVYPLLEFKVAYRVL